MKTTSIFIFTFCLVLAVRAQVPSTMNFQGNLTDPEGIVITDGEYAIDFALWDQDVDGASFWTETQDPVQVINGIFNVKLGSVNPLVPADFAGPLWLEITIAGETLSPRIELATSAYSQAAKSLVGDETLSFYTDGEERMRLNNVGILSIGSPISSGVATKLELNYDDGGTGYGGMWITNSAATARPYYGFQNSNGIAYSYLDGSDANKLKFYNSGDHMVLTTSGNLGIGTTAPPEKLSVTGNIAASDTVKADVFAYNSEKIKYYSITPREFREYQVSHNPNSTATSFPYITGFYYLYGTGGTIGSSSMDLLAPIHLPHGAIIKDVTFYLYDNDVTYNFYSASIYGVTLTTGSSDLSQGVTVPTSESSTVQEISIIGLNHTLDNSANSYWLYVWMPNAGSNLRIYGARIAYVEPGF